MSEKRFEVINARWQGKGEAVAFEDTQTNQVYFAENQEECKRIVDLLNEQQATITELNKQIVQLHLAIEDLLSHTSCDEIKNENEQLRQKLDFYLLDEFEWKEKYGD